MRSEKPGISIFILLIISLASGGLVAEAIARIYVKKSKVLDKQEYLEEKLNDYHRLKIGTFDEDLGWGLKRNASEKIITSDFSVDYSINSKGLRGGEFNAGENAGKFIILVLGESNVFGEGIRYGDRFTEIIQRSLKNSVVVNMGVWGYGIDQSLLQLKRDGFGYNPELVILFVIADFLDRSKYCLRPGISKPRFVLDDKKEDIVLERLSDNKEQYAQQMPTSRLKRLEDRKKPKYSFFKRSKLLSLLCYLLRKDGINRALAEKDKLYWSGMMKSAKAAQASEEVYEKQDFRKLIFLILSSYKRECVRRRISFLLVNIELNKIDFLEEACKRLSLDYLDLSDVLNAAAAVHPLQFAIDPHYNDFAHRVIAEAVASYVSKTYELEESGYCKKEFSVRFY